MKIINLFHKDWNLGDWISSPIRYFKFPNIETKNIYGDIENYDYENSHIINGFN